MQPGTRDLRIATYNLKNLFLHGEGEVKPEKEVRPLARMIDQVAAEILVVQEAGSAASLETLNGRLQTPYPHARLLPGNSGRSIHVGVLSRHPVELTTHRDLTLSDAGGNPLFWYPDERAARNEAAVALRMQRDIVLAELRVQDCQLALFGVHLKSRTNVPWQRLAAEDMRAAEVRALAERVADYRERHPRAVIAVLGDFNDRLSADSLAPLRELELEDPLGDALKAAGRNPSTYWPKRRMRIDHILLARAEATNPTIHINHMARQASDHYPVSLEIDI